MGSGPLCLAKGGVVAVAVGAAVVAASATFFLYVLFAFGAAVVVAAGAAVVAAGCCAFANVTKANIAAAAKICFISDCF